MFVNSVCAKLVKEVGGNGTVHRTSFRGGGMSCLKSVLIYFEPKDLQVRYGKEITSVYILEQVSGEVMSEC